MTQKPNMCTSALMLPIHLIAQLHCHNAVFSVNISETSNVTSHNRPYSADKMLGNREIICTKDNCIMETATEDFENGDTITQNDAVRIQYSSLPYPPVRKDKLKDEEHHYNTVARETPSYTMPSIKLDNVNNFLYHGGQTFGYVHSYLKEYIM